MTESRSLLVYADGPDGPLPDPYLVAELLDLDDPEVLLGWVTREPPWLASTKAPVSTLLTGPGTRAAVAAGRVRAVPARLSALPGLLAGRLRPDVAVVAAHEEPGGRWRAARSLGYALTAARSASRVVVERWPGAAPLGHPPLDVKPDEVLDRTDPPDPPPPIVASDDQLRIAELVAGLVPDGATVQWGPGVLGALFARALTKPVRVHSGLVTEELVVDLHGRGLLIGSAEAAYCWGSDDLWDMVDQGRISMLTLERSHDITALSALPRFVAVNAALQVGLDGAVNVEVARGRVISGAGGHPDFAAAASRSPGGMSIVALVSMSGAHSRIVARPEVVSTPRSDIDVVVTEHGVADLRHLDAPGRAKRLIAIAAPEHREALADAAREMFG